MRTLYKVGIGAGVLLALSTRRRAGRRSPFYWFGEVSWDRAVMLGLPQPLPPLSEWARENGGYLLRFRTDPEFFWPPDGHDAGEAAGKPAFARVHRVDGTWSAEIGIEHTPPAGWRYRSLAYAEMERRGTAEPQSSSSLWNWRRATAQEVWDDLVDQVAVADRNNQRFNSPAGARAESPLTQKGTTVVLLRDLAAQNWLPAPAGSRWRIVRALDVYHNGHWSLQLVRLDHDPGPELGKGKSFLFVSGPLDEISRDLRPEQA